MLLVFQKILFNISNACLPSDSILGLENTNHLVLTSVHEWSTVHWLVKFMSHSATHVMIMSKLTVYHTPDCCNLMFFFLFMPHGTDRGYISSFIQDRSTFLEILFLDYIILRFSNIMIAVVGILYQRSSCNEPLPVLIFIIIITINLVKWFKVWQGWSCQ